MIQWIGLSNKNILESFRQTIDNIVLPMVIVGDLIREVVAHEGIKYAETIGTDVIGKKINEDTFDGISKEFTWLVQLLYGQQLALELSKRLGTNPDTIRSDQYPYKHATDHLTL